MHIKKSVTKNNYDQARFSDIKFFLSVNLYDTKQDPF